MPCDRQDGGSGTAVTEAKRFFRTVTAALRDTLTKADFLKLTDRNRGIINPGDASFVAKTQKDEYKWNQP